MQDVIELYRGFQIVVRALLDHEDRWDFEYRIDSEDAVTPHPWTRGRCVGGSANADAARRIGLAAARAHIDHLLDGATA